MASSPTAPPTSGDDRLPNSATRRPEPRSAAVGQQRRAGRPPQRRLTAQGSPRFPPVRLDRYHHASGQNLLVSATGNVASGGQNREPPTRSRCWHPSTAMRLAPTSAAGPAATVAVVAGVRIHAFQISLEIIIEISQAQFSADKIPVL